MTIPTDKSLYLICGEDEFRVSFTADELILALVPESDREFGLEKIEGRADNVNDTVTMIHSVVDALSSVGLFSSGAKTVYLREPSFLVNDRVGKSELVKEAVARLVAIIKGGLPHGQRLVVSTTKINHASVFYKAFAGKDSSITDFGNGLKPRDKAAAAAQLLEEFSQRIGIKMEPAVRQIFLARVGTDSRQIVSELQKIACYCGNVNTATADDVRDIISSGAVSEIWDFVDAFCRRDANTLMKQVRIQLGQGENAIRMANSLLTSVSELLAIREGIDRQWLSGGTWQLPPEIDSGLAAGGKDVRSVMGFRFRKLSEQAALWTLRDLRMARHYVLSLREELVSRSLPEAFILETRLLQAIGIKRKTT